MTSNEEVRGEAVRRYKGFMAQDAFVAGAEWAFRTAAADESRSGSFAAQARLEHDRATAAETLLEMLDADRTGTILQLQQDCIAAEARSEALAEPLEMLIAAAYNASFTQREDAGARRLKSAIESARAALHPLPVSGETDG